MKNSIDDFEEAVKEVYFLIEKSSKNTEEDNKNYENNIYLKSALILLIAKFETFLEKLVSEYVEELSNKKFSSAKTEILNLVFYNITKNFEKIRNDIDKTPILSLEEKENAFKKWQRKSLKRIDDIKPPKFSIGKHGEKAIVKLFKDLRFEDVFSEIIIKEKISSISGVSENSIDIKNEINHFLRERNLIIHEDKSINFTYQEIEKLTRRLFKFSTQLNALLENKLNLYN